MDTLVRPAVNVAVAQSLRFPAVGQECPTSLRRRWEARECGSGFFLFNHEEERSKGTRTFPNSLETPKPPGKVSLSQAQRPTPASPPAPP